MLYTLPVTSIFGKSLSNSLIRILWNGLSHPPLSFLGENFRTKDGTGMSLVLPELGHAGAPYARSIQPLYPLPLTLPEPDDIFDSILAREEFKPHPSGISSNLFYFAALIIHDLFNTMPKGQADISEVIINQTSSYLDLSPLYGNSQVDQCKIRTMSSGMLKPDTFSDSRALLMTPGLSGLLIMFSRNHNRIAEKLLQINENGRFSCDSKTALDEKLFQTARYINCCFYLNIVLHDYLRTIFRSNFTTSTWYLDISAPIPGVSGEDPLPFATGNQNSVEFNFVYRWHAAISKEDGEWVNNEFKEFFGIPDPEKITRDVFFDKISKWQKELNPDPSTWEFDNLKRGEDGKFQDADLGRIFVNGSDWVAGAFGPGNIPKALRIIEILGMSEARRWGVCSLNEFRKFIGCKVYQTFEEINPNKAVADTLFKLYKHVDNVELYPGLLAEETKPSIPGSGICLGYSTSRAILFDATTLVRGDKLYTLGKNPMDLTIWGYNDCHGDPSIAQGAVLNKILFSGLPGFFKYNSVYALYPFTVPTTMKKILTDNHLDSLFDFSRPAPSSPPTFISDYNEVKRILNANDEYKVLYEPKMAAISEGNGSFLSWHNAAGHDADRKVLLEVINGMSNFPESLKNQQPEKSFKKRHTLYQDRPASASTSSIMSAMWYQFTLSPNTSAFLLKPSKTDTVSSLSKSCTVSLFSSLPSSFWTVTKNRVCNFVRSRSVPRRTLHQL